MDADDRADRQVGVYQRRAVQRIRRHEILLPALAQQDDAVLLLRRVFPDKTRKLKLVFHDLVRAAVKRKLFLSIDVFEPGQFPVRFMNLGGNVFPRDRNLPDQSAELLLHTGHPHLAPQIYRELGVIRYPLTHCPFPP